jgi:hypothetical protein
MSLHFVNISRKTFLKDYKQLYRFTTLDRFIELLNSNSLIFINPSLWTDPYEKFYLERDFIISEKNYKLPAKDKVFAVCVSGTISSEAYWKVYAPKEDGVRLTINTEKLLDLLDNVKNADIYIGKVNYQIMEDFNRISFVKKGLIEEINSGIVGEQQIRLLLKKRKSFLYENEIRIIVVPHRNTKENKLFKIQTDITEFTTKYMFDPRLGQNHFKVLREYFFTKFDIKVSHSRLFKEQTRDPINLTDGVRTRRKE